MLKKSFDRLFSVVEQHGKIRSLALPLLATGIYGAPVDLCSKILLESIKDFMENVCQLKNNNLKEIHIVNYDKSKTDTVINIFDKSETLLSSLSGKINSRDEYIYKSQLNSEKNSNYSNYNDKSKSKISSYSRDDVFYRPQLNSINATEETSNYNHTFKREISSSSEITYNGKIVLEKNNLISCSSCKQKVKEYFLSNCKHNYCLGCKIELKENNFECIIGECSKDISKFFSKKTQFGDGRNASEMSSFRICEICTNISNPTNPIIQLPKCNHEMCNRCMEKISTMNPKCPFCQTFYGESKGDQPKNGQFKHRLLESSLSG